MSQPISIGSYTIGAGSKPLLIAGPCVIESADMTMRIADTLAAVPETSRYQLVFKASYLKDNRSAGGSYRGPGPDEGLAILSRVREAIGCPVLSDVHAVSEIEAAAEVLDVVQIPAFLCRQTSLIEAAASRARALNIKKGQFMAPEDMGNVVEKARAAGGHDIMLTERGSTFGYHNLVVDFRAIPRMRETGCPVIFDVTHSLQRPGALGQASGGEPALAGMMARAAAATEIDGLFVETHPAPGEALSDGAAMVSLEQLPAILAGATRVFDALTEDTE